MTNDRKEIKKKRIGLLKEIDVWNAKRCDNCKFSGLNGASIDCQCEAAVKVRALGQELDELTLNVREAQVKKLIDKAEAEGWTIDLYLEFKELEMTDRDILKVAGYPKKVFDAWLRANGIYRGKMENRPEIEIPLERD